ncbi:Structure-specific endonuclease subunit slx1 [Zostera marina]|uniref:Structure-specific endonuclease subunit slx1 n=1 Tax=Zostera marina TaxID=29655 RepID=A0A0K9NKX3_ZOSMR|nr:Structure-specific endonuclease subunit slx1 [Zostera marina]
MVRIGGRSRRTNEDDLETERVSGNFFACYLLCSTSPRFKGQTYIGFTTNPRRRIRQHNGELTSGAIRTKRKRPWEMVLCIHGFPTNVSALQFEWAWQHPKESLAVRKSAATMKSLSGVANKVKIAYTMLTLPSWDHLNLTVNYFSSNNVKYVVGCPSLPSHMRLTVLARISFLVTTTVITTEKIVGNSQCNNHLRIR